VASASASVGEARSGGAAPLPWGLLAAVGIDLVIDGLLVGLGATLGSKQGLVLTIALTVEILFLVVSVVAQLLEQGQQRARAAQLAGCLGLLTAVGALAGAALLGGASRSTLAAVLAFGAAALLYLWWRSCWWRRTRQMRLRCWPRCSSWGSSACTRSPDDTAAPAADARP